MSRLIDADELWMDIIRNIDCCGDVLDVIERQPTAYPVRYGHWIARTFVINYGTKSKTKIYTQCACSVCGAQFGGKSDNFCYHCGAKMDEVSE